MSSKKLFMILGLILIVTIIILILIKQDKKTKPIPISVNVLMIINQVNVIRNGEKIPIQSGDILKENDTIITGERSSLELGVENKFRILLKEKTELSLKSLKKILKEKTQNQYHFFLRKGKIFTKLDQIRKNDSWNIKTPIVAVGVRGTGFILETDLEVTELKVREGTVEAIRNISHTKEYQELISANVLEQEKIKVNLNENQKVLEMIKAKRLDLPKITKEKVVKDPDFDYYDAYFNINSSVDGGILIITKTKGSLVFLNKILIGEGDLSYYLNPGIYQIRVENKNEIFEETIEIKAGEKKEIIPLFKKKKKDEKLEYKKPDTDTKTLE